MIAPCSRMLLFLGISAAACIAERPITFEHEIRPILKAHCTHCHGEEEKLKGGVDLRLRHFLDRELDGGGHIIVPGHPEKSELIRLVKTGEMPDKGKPLTPEQISLI